MHYKCSKTRLLYSETLKNVKNHSIASFIHKIMKILYPSDVRYTKTLTLCREVVLFTLAAFPLLKVLYPHAMHTTCLEPYLNRVANKYGTNLLK